MPRITQKKKVIITAAILIVGSFFLFSGRPAQAYLNDYSKLWDGTLSAGEWNNLASDFLNKSGAATMTGPLGINITAPASGLQVNGPIVGSSYGGSMSAGNISSGYFGSNTSGGNYSFPGFVGIGTSSPAYTLDVVGDINLTGSLLYNGSPLSSSQWLTNSTAIYYNNGNVGIGTSAPTSRLTLTGGDFQIDHNRSIMVNYGANSTVLFGNYADSQGFGYGTSTTYTASIAVEGDVKGNRFCIKEDCKAAWTDIVAAGGGGQWTVNGSDMYNANSGNIGIGTTNPAMPLEVKGASAPWGSLKLSSNDGVAGAVYGGQASSLYGYIGSGYYYNTTLWRTQNTAAANVIFNNDGSMAFNTNSGLTANTDYMPTERLRINTSGNVGIGTNNPVDLLEAYRSTGSVLRLTGDVNSASSSIDILEGTGVFGVAGTYGFRINYNGTTNIFNLVSSNGTTVNTRMSVDRDSGNVGIGNTAPTTKLYVAGTSLNTLATTHSLLGGAGNVLVMADNTGTLYSTTTAALINPIVTSASGWTANGTTVYKSDTSGNVGIGTTAPGQKLDVTGNINIPSGSAYKYNGVDIARGITSSGNYFFGGGSGNLTMTGSNNIAAGSYSFTANTTGSWNVAIGNALYRNTTGAGNVAINDEALAQNVSGNSNVAIGDDAMPSNVAGSWNTGVGDGVLSNLNTATNTGNNTAVGRNTGGGLVTGVNNTIIGANVTGLAAALSNYVIIADGSGSRRIVADNNGNVGIGITNPTTQLYVAGTLLNTLATTHSLLGGAGNAVVMTDNTGTLYSTSTASFISNNGLGLWKGTLNGTIYNGDAGAGNVGIGTTTPNNLLQVNDLIEFDNSKNRTYIGYQAGKYDLGVSNTYIGNMAGSADNATGKTTSANNNTAVGFRSLYSDDWGYGNTSNGAYSLYSNVGGYHNTASGYMSLYFNDGVRNTANGQQSLYSNTSGWNNTASGHQSLYSNTTGSGNVVNGTFALYANITGSYNIANGYEAGRYIADGVTDNQTVNNSIFLGRATRANANGQTNQIVIGDSAIGNGSNTATLGNDSILATILKGNVGIGITNPTAKLYVAGSLLNTLATTHSLLGGAGNVIVMADNTGTLYSTSTASFISGNSLDLWEGTKNGSIHNGDAGAGNVGIGTTNTYAKLSVSGDIGFLKGNNLMWNDVNDSIMTMDNPAWLANQNTMTFNAYAGAWVFRDTEAGNIPMVIYGSGAVGIGTTTPEARLHVSDGLYKDVYIGEPYAIGVPDLSVLGAGVMFTRTDSQYADSGIAAYKSASGGNNLVIKGRSDTVFVSGNANDERMRIQELGNVGIGNTAPATKLDVSGSLRNTLATTHSLLGGAGNAVVMTDNTGTLYSTSTASFISGNSLDLWEGTKNGSIHNGDAGAGNVGIGTADTSAGKLTLIGDMYINPGDGIRLSSDGTSSYIDGVENHLVFRTRRTVGSDNISFETSTTTRLFINGPSGNIGIGTTAPGTILNISGSDINSTLFNVVNTVIRLDNTNTTNSNWSGITFRANDTSGGNWFSGAMGSQITSHASGAISGDLAFFTTAGNNFSEKLRILSTGNVGIGNTAPGTKLDVSGTLRNTLATTHSLLGGAGNTFVMTDNTGALYSSNDFSSTGLSLSGTNLIRNADLAFSDNFWAAIGSGGTLVYSRVWSDDATAPVRSHKKVTANITALGTGDVWAIGFNVENLKLNTDYNASCYFKTTGTTDGYFHMERFYSDWTGRSDQNSANFTYANDGVWHRESFVFNTGAYPNVDFRVRGFDIIGSWDITGCQLTEGKQLNSFSLNPLDEIHEGSGRYLTNSSVYGSVSKIISNNYSATNAYSMYVAAPEGAITNKYAFVTEAGAGNIGLGLSNPGTRLEVSGTFKNSLATTHSLLGGGGNVVVMADNTGTLYSTSTASFISSNSLDLWKGTKNGAIWNGDAGVGNVGIGTTNAVDGKLTVAQNMSSYDSAFAASHIKLLANNTIDNLGFVGITYAASTAANYGWSVGANRTAGGESNFVWRYHSSNASGTERMRISDTGNVGIGITNPSAKLNIQGVYNQQGFKMVNDRDDSGINFQVYDPDNITGGVVFRDNNNNNMNVGIGTTAPTASLDIFADNGFQGLNISTQRDSNGILFNVFDRDAPNGGLVVTDHNGTTNVGIGTTTPSARLTIEDSNGDGTPLFNIFDATDHVSAFQVESPDGSNPGVIIKADGNVGFGTTTPLAQLTIANARSDGSIILDLYDPWDHMSAFKVENPDGGSAGVIIKQTGNVGIANTNPTVRLDVSGTFRNTLATTHSLLGGAGNVLVMADNTGALYSTSTAAFIGGANFWGGTKNGTIFNGDAGAGNVGIGTITPTYKLDVNGTFRATASSSSIILDADGNISIGI